MYARHAANPSLILDVVSMKPDKSNPLAVKRTYRAVLRGDGEWFSATLVMQDSGFPVAYEVNAYKYQSEAERNAFEGEF